MTLEEFKSTDDIIIVKKNKYTESENIYDNIIILDDGILISDKYCNLAGIIGTVNLNTKMMFRFIPKETIKEIYKKFILEE